ncbi:TetR/AcrR family transcriptional regulator [Nocardioides aequoreus]|uniref:TetR/AcrR family transcriptional regulator n=1 Tax=Nocardioides aequoreus TaxID=397278 RepID=UPI0014701DF4|nr:TetR/AcrR family transcriptional regulator [Nocardioides aequoreus]
MSSDAVPDAVSGGTTPAGTDGRAARRQRNLEAVLDAVHELFVEGDIEPSPEDVARRSGVSLRSVYRYFPDREQLLLAALQRRLVVAEPLFVLEGAGEGGPEERIAAFLDHRMLLYGAIAPTARVALLAARQLPVIAAVVHHRRSQLHALVWQQFAPELDRLGPERAEAVAAAIDTVCQFEPLEALRRERGLSEESTREVLATMLRALLEPAGMA